MHKYVWITLMSIIVSLPILHSAQILGIFPAYSKSHNSINQSIIKSLAARGHNVTVISYFKSNTSLPNYTEIILTDNSFSYIDSISVEQSYRWNGINMFLTLERRENFSCETIFRLDYVKHLVQSRKKYINLILADTRFTQCFNLLAEILDVPVISVQPPAVSLADDLMIGNPMNPAIVPMITSGFTTKMDFLQRVQNTLHFFIYYTWYYLVSNRYLDDMALTHFAVNSLPFEVLQRRVALTFYNNHVSFMTRATAPNAIDIAGIHIQEPNILPKHIQEFIDDANYGVILFSLGTTIRASSIAAETLDVIKDVFTKIPQKVLWRIDDPNLVSIPGKVLADKWLPQRDILEHTNVVGFISHCGALSTMEAIYTGTPVIGLPVTFDQPQNARVLVEHGMAVFVDYKILTGDALIFAINEITNNTKYLQNAQKLSRAFKDRPISPLDSAIYWTEYVLRYNGAHHLRLQSVDMPLYQYLLLDVATFLLTVTVIMAWFSKHLFQWIAAIKRKLIN